MKPIRLFIKTILIGAGIWGLVVLASAWVHAIIRAVCLGWRLV